ncbi:MAG: GntR family transcriptional regulator [Antricoccus sp.]
MSTSLRSGLAAQIVDDLRTAIMSGQYEQGQKLPTEAMLCRKFGVSRATVRSAIRELDVLGLVWTRQGAGTFVQLRPSVHDGLERLGSISDSILASGKTPSQQYGRRTIRQVLPDEAARMGVPADTEVLELRRRITADGEVVAYSYDLLPMSMFPEQFEPEELAGSIFAYFINVLGLRPQLGIAEVHAVESSHISWGPDAGRHRLFILLDQLQYDDAHVLICYSRSYFVEGAYVFRLVRTNA